jgi:hypothetical protein
MTGRLTLCVLIAALLQAVSSSTVFAFGSLTTDPIKINREWIGIGPSSFSGALATLRDFRVSQGHSACVWTLDELDASYGGHSPSQLRQALQDAFANWTANVCGLGNMCEATEGGAV